MALMANVSIAGCVIDEVRIWRAVPLEIGADPPLARRGGSYYGEYIRKVYEFYVVFKA